MTPPDAVVAHVGEAHPLGWWIPAAVFVAAVMGPMSGAVDVRRHHAAAWLASEAAGTPAVWWRRLSALLAAAACVLAVAVGARRGFADAVTWGVWVAAVPLAALVGPWPAWLGSWRSTAPVAERPASADAAAAPRPVARWPAVASLAVLAWLPAALPFGRDAAVLTMALTAYLGAHAAAAVWWGRSWWARSEGLGAVTTLLGDSSLVGVGGGRLRLLAAQPRRLGAPEAALLAVAVAAPAPQVLAGLPAHGSRLLGLLGPRPVQTAVLVAIAVAVAIGVGRLATSGLAGRDRATVAGLLAAGWVVAGGIERLAPTWSEGTAEPAALAAATGQLAAAAVAHAGAALRVHQEVGQPRRRLLAGLGLAASAAACAVFIVGL